MLIRLLLTHQLCSILYNRLTNLRAKLQRSNRMVKMLLQRRHTAHQQTPRPTSQRVRHASHQQTILLRLILDPSIQRNLQQRRRHRVEALNRKPLYRRLQALLITALLHRLLASTQLSDIQHTLRFIPRPDFSVNHQAEHKVISRFDLFGFHKLVFS